MTKPTKGLETMEVQNNSLEAKLRKADVGIMPTKEVKSDGVTLSNSNKVDTQAVQTVTISEKAKALLAAEGNGSGNEPPQVLGNGSGNEPPLTLGNGSGNEPPLALFGNGSGNEPPKIK